MGGIAGLTGLIFLMSLLLPSRYELEDSILIRKTGMQVYQKIADPLSEGSWRPWEQGDAELHTEMKGRPGEAGQEMEWNSRLSGSGKMILEHSEAGAFLQFKIIYQKPYTLVAEEKWLFEDLGQETRVTWKGRLWLGSAVGKLVGPMLRKQAETRFADGLDQLKDLCEGEKEAGVPDIRKSPVMVFL